MPPPLLCLVATLLTRLIHHAAEPSRATVAHGIIFLPLDFYLKNREALGLNEDQVREMDRIAEELRESGEKIEVAQNPVDQDKVMGSFERLLQAENEMKMLQFRARIAMRKVLTPEQFEKVQGLAKKAVTSRGGAAGGDVREMFEQVRRGIGKRSGGGEPPRELVEKLEQVEQAVKHGRGEEAKRQLEGMLRHLREERGSREPEKAKRAEGSERKRDGIDQEMREIAEAIERTTDPEQRERLQKQMGKLRENQEPSRGASEARRPDEGSAPAGAEGLEKRMRAIGEVAKRTDNPELRERLEGALKRLREAKEAGNREAIDDIMHAIEPLLRDLPRPGTKQKE